jgi:hypothetical protein
MQAAFHNNRQRCGTSNAHKEGEALVCSRSYVGVWAGYGPRQEPHGQWGVSCRTPRGRRWAPRSPQGHPPCRPSWRRQTQPCEADRRADTTGWRVRKADVGKQVRVHPLQVARRLGGVRVSRVARVPCTRRLHGAGRRLRRGGGRGASGALARGGYSGPGGGRGGPGYPFGASGGGGWGRCRCPWAGRGGRERWVGRWG